GVDPEYVRPAVKTPRPPERRILEADFAAERRAAGRVSNGRRSRAARAERVRIDVPRLELDRIVVVELEPVPRCRECLSASRFVEQLNERAVLRERRTQVCVLEREP